MLTAVALENPYVGPRPFEREDSGRFFGRDQEAGELLSLIVANRVVVLYAPSGAGKTSLLNAQVVPLLEEEGLEVLPHARVQGALIENVASNSIANIFAFYAILSWAGDQEDPADCVSYTLAEFLTERLPRREDEYGSPRPRVLIFDQFEELFTAYPHRWQDREGFFNQLNAALKADPFLRIVLSIREDYIAQLDTYADLLPRHLRTRFRLERMRPDAALQAIRGPLAQTNRTFAPGVARQLVEDLRKVRVESMTGEISIVVGEFIEPVQLQVVAQNLWQDLPADVMTITESHLQAYGDVNQALIQFYERVLGQTRQESPINERQLRQWFTTQLITPAGTRGTVYRGAQETGGISNEAVQVLENLHLIRGEWRAGARWYELTHDRLIEPIQQSNKERRELRRRRLLAFGAVTFMGLLILSFVVLWSQLSPGAIPEDTSQFVESITAVAGITATANQSQMGTRTMLDMAATEEAHARATADVLTATAVGQERATATSAYYTRVAQDADATLEASLRLTAEHMTAVANATEQAAARATAAAAVELAEAAGDALERSHQRPLRIGVSIGGANSKTAGTLSCFVQDAEGVVYLLSFVDILGLPDYAAGAPVLQPGPIDGGLLISEREGADTDVVAHFVQVTPPAPAASIPITTLIGLARLDNTISFETSHPDIGPVRGVADPVLGAEVSVLGRTSGLATGRIDQLNVTAALSVNFFGGRGENIINVTGGFTVAPVQVSANSAVFSSVFAPGNEGALVLDEAGNAIGIVVGERNAAAVVAPLRPFLDSLNLDLLFSGQQLFALSDHEAAVTAAAISPDNLKVATGDSAGDIYLYDLTNLTADPILIDGHRGAVRSLAFSPDSRTLASASDDQNIFLWQVQTQPIPQPSFLSSRGGTIWSIDFSPDGRQLVSAHEDGNIRLWGLGDLGAAPAVLFGHEGDVLAVDFSADGEELVSGGQDGTVRVWTAPIVAQRPIIVGAHEGAVLSVAFDPAQAAQVVSAGEDGTIQVWPTVPGREPILTLAHEGAVPSLAFRPTVSILASAEANGTIQVRDLAALLAGQPTEPLIFTGSEGGNVIAVSANGRWLVSGGDDGIVRVWLAR